MIHGTANEAEKLVLPFIRQCAGEMTWDFSGGSIDRFGRISLASTTKREMDSHVRRG